MQKEKKVLRRNTIIKLVKERPPVGASEVRNHFFHFLDTIENNPAPITVTRRGHASMVMLPQSVWSGIAETLYLMSSKANWEALQEAIQESYNKHLPSTTPNQLRARAAKIAQSNAKK